MQIELMDRDKILRKQLISILTEEHAHASLDAALEGLDGNKTGEKANLPYTIWQVTEHIRITSWDIVQFSKHKDHISPQWPDEYWPESERPASISEWKNTVNSIKSHQKEMVDLVSNSKRDLFAPFPWGNGQTLFREALLIIDHTSYHTGQIILIRKLLGIWD